MSSELGGRIAELMDRVLASDPGLGRLRMAASGASAMGTSLAVEYGYAKLIGADFQHTLISMLLGAVVAMMGSMGLSGTGTLRKVRTAVFFPVAIGLGLSAGIGVGDRTAVMLVVFVLIMFLAVYVRRFGPAFFFYGFMVWMGYFFSSFLHATVDMLPQLIVAVVISSAWILLLSVTVLGTNPARTLRRTLRAYEARARAVARACAELLEVPEPDSHRYSRWQRRLAARQAGLAEAALMVEGWSEEDSSLPLGWSGPALRRAMIDSQQTMDRIARSAVALAGGDRELVTAAIGVLEPLARRQDLLARSAAKRLAELSEDAESVDRTGWWPSRHLAVAALEFLDLASRSASPPDVRPVDEYTATTPLAMGNLPGAAAVARGVPARGAHWNPFARMDMTTRQSIQVAVAGAVAIVLGRELSPTRYYWAVIAAFVVFTGTGTRSETFIKGSNRVIGTVVGLFASILLANLTAGHTAWVLAVIIASMFFGFYLIRLSYAYMIFFVTIMVGQMYSVLHEFSDGLLVLRLEETAIGAGTGIVVALIVTPLSTRDTVRIARDNLLTALHDLLMAGARTLRGHEPVADLDALSRALDNRARELTLVAKPLTRPLLWGNSSLRSRHRLSLYLATAAHSRALAVGIRREPPEDRGSAAAICEVLAEASIRLTDASIGKASPSLSEPLAEADSRLFRGASSRAGASASDPVLRPLIHLHSVLTELAITARDVEKAAPPLPVDERVT